MTMTRRRVTMGLTTMVALAALTPMSPATAQPLPETPSRMRLDIESLSPRVITSATPTITITGKVTNTGDRRIDDVRVQLRRGTPIETEQQLLNAKELATEAANSPFISVTGTLEQGQSAPLTITVPVRESLDSLHIDTPGLYPLLVNINGRPEFGGRARLATSTVLLPALSIPDGPAVPTPPDPRRLTVLWPLTDDHPRQIGTVNGHVLLSDDELATSLAPGGRLYGLTNTVAQASPAVLEALCFAIDPDLLGTASEMAKGYQVRDPGGQVVDGKGAATAKTWLERLRGLTSGRCVLRLPYADTDLVALSGAGAVDLEQLALTGDADVTKVLPAAQPLAGVLWPAGGVVDQRTLLDLAAERSTTVLADPAHLRQPEGSGPYRIGDSNAVHAVPIDSLISSYLDNPQQSVQNGIAALAFRAAFAKPGGAPMLIAPPRRWNAPAGELAAFVQTLQQLVAAELVAPQPLGELVAAGPNGTVTGLNYTPEDTASEIGRSITAEVVRINSAQRDLLGAMAVDDRDRVDPRTLVAPFQYGLLRATSSAYRGQAGLAERAVAEVAAQLDALRSQVTVTNPGRPLTLASGNSPIPVPLRNGLPVLIQVKIKLSETPGLRPERINDVVIPARGSINVYLPAEVNRSGRFTVDVSLATPGGTTLGSTARLELTSTTYGTITLIVTGTAAGALFLLAGLRIFRRVRAARAAPPGEQPPIEDGAD